MYICKVFMNKLPSNISASLNSGAQQHHAGVDMVFKFYDRPEIKEYCKNGFGTTIVLEESDVSLNGSEEKIIETINFAKSFDYVAGLIYDESYPIGGKYTLNLLTCGYILADKDDEIWNFNKNHWKLFKPT